MAPQLCLGTAQFGFAYGITNHAGQVAEDEVRTLLADVAASGFTTLDTAQAYGEAESVVGRALPRDHSFKLISKLSTQRQSFYTSDDCILWDQAFQTSCSLLGQPRLDAFLLHSPSDLRKPGSEFLLDWLMGLKTRGLVRRLGVSIYCSNDLEGLPADLLDIVQLPLSLYDQRLLVDGTVARLRAQGCAIYARSIYLQGLLLCPASTWPAWVNPVVRAHHSALEDFAARRGGSLLQCAIGFARAQSHLEAVVLGLCSRSELKQLTKAWQLPSLWRDGEWRNWALTEADILDPRRWPR